MQNIHKALMFSAVGLILVVFLAGMYLKFRKSAVSDLIVPYITQAVVDQDFENVITEQEQADYSFVLIDGNIYKEHSSGKRQIIIDTADFADESIEEFVQVAQSPDKSKICFLGQSIVPMWLYVSRSDGSGIVRVDVAKNCSWSPDSKKIAYNNHTTDVSPVDLHIYDLATASKKNLTDQYSGELDFCNFRLYDNPSWTDENTVMTDYRIFECKETEPEKGSARINIQTGQIQ